MGRTFIRQETQIRNSDLYDDSLVAGSGLESQASVEGDLNALRSQLKRFSGEAKWYTALAGRDIKTLGTDLTDLEGKKLLRRIQVLTDLTVPATQNWKILSVAGSEAPTQVAAVAGTNNGAVVAQSALSGAGFNVHELIEVAGPNAITPNNLAVVIDATTGQKIQSASRDVFALLQYESTGLDGGAFDDVSAGNRVKLSFVRLTAGRDDLEACPVADIEGKSINYAYVGRINLDAIPEYAFLNGTFVDQAASVDVTLDNAVDNQGGPVTQTAKNIEWRIDDTYKVAFQDSTGAVDILAVKPAAGGDVLQVNGASLDVNSAANDFAAGVTVASAGQPINVGVTAGQIDANGALAVASGAATDLTLRGTREMFLDDGNQTGSTWAQTGGIKLSDTTAEWDNFAVKFGEVSLLNAIVQAAASNTRSKTVGVVTAAHIPANTNVTGAGGTPNIDAQLGDYTGKTFVTDVDVYLNGELMRNGVDLNANHDVYPGTSVANGDLKFEFVLKINDVITMIIW